MVLEEILEKGLFETPVLFLIFNRPDLSEKVFGQIKKARPRKLFIAADGPRTTHPEDVAKCAATRKVVMDMIDWDCEVKTLFREENLGCGLAVSQAITWFFEHVEMGIILEDDCYPDLSFFGFCREMLKYYVDNEQVMHISGNNFQNGKRKFNSSYYFSHYSHSWGWATWKRAWAKNDFELQKLEEYLRRHNNDKNSDEFAHFSDLFKKLGQDQIKHIWDYQWLFTLWFYRGLAVLPNINLVSNMGFGNDATHTISESKFSKMMISEMKQIIHPKVIKRDIKADNYTFRTMFKKKRNVISYLKNYTLLRKSYRKWEKLITNNKASRIFKKYHHYTMIPKNTYINNLLLCKAYSYLTGCIVECGVWRGGMSAGMADMLGDERYYYLFDSFEGLPSAKSNDGKSALEWQKNKEGSYFFNNCKAEQSYANRAMDLSDSLKFEIVKGWFNETIPNHEFSDKIAILRLDGDWYDSTILCLNKLYPLVTNGGIIIIDDYATWDGCSRAIHDYLSKNNLPCRIRCFNNEIYYIIKE